MSSDAAASNDSESAFKAPPEPVQLDPVEVPIYGASGNETGKRTFTPGVTRNYPNVPLLKEAVRRQLGRQRQGTASTKNRSEIKGSGKKPWRQKGTGRARAGSRKSPIWRGGGVVFGPKPRKYDYGLPRKQRRLARRHALLSKLLDGETSIVEQLPTEKPSTAEIRRLLDNMGIRGSCLIGIDAGLDAPQVKNLLLSCRNLERVRVMAIAEADTLSLLKHRALLLTAGAFDEVQQKESEVQPSLSDTGGDA